MLWIFTLIGEILFGIELTSFILANRIDFYVMCAIGSIIGLGISTIIFFGCSAILGMSSFHVLVHTIGISSVAYLLIMRKVIKKINLVGKPTKKHFIFFLVSIIFSFFFIPNNYLPKSHVFQANISLDMSEEISIINSFYHGVNSGLMNIFKIRHPSCYQCVCRSRWITALNSAILKLGYSPEKVSITVPSMIMIFSFCFIFLNLSHLFLDSVFGSVISLFLFFFTGGYGFTSLLYKNVRKNKNLDFIYDNGFRQSNWYHPIYYYYLSSRPSQFSLCIVSSIFYLLASTHQSYFHQKSESDGKMNEIINRKSKNRQNNRPLMTIIGVLLGLLPGNQIQVFLAILVYLLIFSINEFPFRFPRKQKEKLIEFFLLGVAFSLTSILQFLQYFPRQTNLNILVKKTIFKSLIEKGSFFPMLTFCLKHLDSFHCLHLLYHGQSLI
ncbi:hypothetical protein TRFO_38111 [Tritrichomonas foetus]|uniref:Uncharacterized protein n=1 Tax=Tritrichomonas foetus TaxID=1144522 RepID=A0A1J4JE89_9EUKA|nr:hypothetical protein TRFO_38111 [Tritrichomonas foetus]|eukprot:OHS95757.1 hypothetical protein TRFO_38111 [Tritrichomonas foetus]